MEEKMKECYIGDIKDYYKYSLVELITKAFNRKVLYVWLLTPPDGKNEGNDNKYLDKPEKYAYFNPILFEKLKTLIHSKKEKNIKQIEEILENKDTYFYTEELQDDLEKRKLYFSEINEITIKKKIDLIFFDPDNGLEKKIKMGNKNSNKYVYWEEIKHFWTRGKDIIIFQYYPRYKNMEEYIQETINNCKLKLNIKKNENINIIKTDAHIFFIYLRHEPAEKENENILKLKINKQDMVFTFDDLFCKYYDNKDNIYTYNIEKNKNVDIGYGIATKPILTIIESDLYKITDDIIKSIETTNKEKKDLLSCNLDIESLQDYYFDNNGNLYFIKDNMIYKFNAEIKYLKKVFIEHQEKKLKLIATNFENTLQLYNYGGDNGKWVLKGDNKIIESGMGVFIGDYIDRRYGGMLKKCN